MKQRLAQEKMSFLSYCTSVLDRVLISEQTFFIQATSAVLLSFVVYAFCQLSNAFFYWYTKDKSYIPTVIEVGKLKLKNMLGVDVRVFMSR